MVVNKILMRLIYLLIYFTAKTRHALVLLMWPISRLMMDRPGEQSLVCDEVQVSRGENGGWESSGTGRSLSWPKTGKPSSLQYEWRARSCHME